MLETMERVHHAELHARVVDVFDLHANLRKTNPAFAFGTIHSDVPMPTNVRFAFRPFAAPHTAPAGDQVSVERRRNLLRGRAVLQSLL